MLMFPQTPVPDRDRQRLGAAKEKKPVVKRNTEVIVRWRRQACTRSANASPRHAGSLLHHRQIVPLRILSWLFTNTR